MICLFWNSSIARIWVRIRHAERVELARKRQVSVYSSLMKFPYGCFFIFCRWLTRTLIKPTLKICDFQDMGSHLPLGDRRARSSGGECANIRITKFPYLSPSTFVSHNFGSIHSPRYARNVGHRFVKNSYQLFFYCSPLAAIQHLISVFSSACTVYLLARQYTAFAVCTLKYHFKGTLLGGRLSFFIVRLRRDRRTQNALRFEYGYCRSGQYDI